jgi:hypothetical protein
MKDLVHKQSTRNDIVPATSITCKCFMFSLLQILFYIIFYQGATFTLINVMSVIKYSNQSKNYYSTDTTSSTSGSSGERTARYSIFLTHTSYERIERNGGGANLLVLFFKYQIH